jgi:hypothetical protein
MKTFKHLITAASAVVLATSVSIASADADPVGYFESELSNTSGYTFVGHVPEHGTANSLAFIPTVEDIELGVEIAAFEQMGEESLVDWRTANN